MDRRNWLHSSRILRGSCAGLALLLAFPLAAEAGLFHHKRHRKPKNEAPAPAQVLGIVVEPLADGLRMQIDCSSRVKFHWGTSDSPRSLYVDVDGAQIARALRHLSIGANDRTEVRSDPRGPQQVRISMGLSEGAVPRVEHSEDGRSITIYLQSPASPPASLEPMPATLPAEDQIERLPRHPNPPPDLSPGQPSPRPTGARVTGLDVENLSASEAVVRIRVAGAASACRPFRLSNPARLVLEFPGAQHSVDRLPRFTGAGPLTLGSVWSAQFTQSPPVTRVVVRLPQETTPFSLEPRDAGGELKVRIGSPAAATARPVSSLRPTTAVRPAHFRRGLHVGIDPGHGGSDPGAMNPALGVCEKNITLDIACRLGRLLEQSGVRVSMTRRDDRRLEHADRIAFVSHGDTDVFVSVHCDAIEGRPQWTGITTYYHGGSAAGHELAAALQSRLPGATGLPDRGARSDLTRFPRSGFYVLRDARMPAVLIECGYVSNGMTARKMSRPAFRQQVAQGIAEGLRKYWEDRAPRTPVASR